MTSQRVDARPSAIASPRTGQGSAHAGRAVTPLTDVLNAMPRNAKIKRAAEWVKQKTGEDIRPLMMGRTGKLPVFEVVAGKPEKAGADDAGGAEVRIQVGDRNWVVSLPAQLEAELRDGAPAPRAALAFSQDALAAGTSLRVRDPDARGVDRTLEAPAPSHQIAVASSPAVLKEPGCQVLTAMLGPKLRSAYGNLSRSRGVNIAACEPESDNVFRLSLVPTDLKGTVLKGEDAVEVRVRLSAAFQSQWGALTADWVARNAGAHDLPLPGSSRRAGAPDAPASSFAPMTAAELARKIDTPAAQFLMQTDAEVPAVAFTESGAPIDAHLKEVGRFVAAALVAKVRARPEERQDPAIRHIAETIGGAFPNIDRILPNSRWGARSRVAQTFRNRLTETLKNERARPRFAGLVTDFLRDAAKVDAHREKPSSAPDSVFQQVYRGVADALPQHLTVAIKTALAEAVDDA